MTIRIEFYFDFLSPYSYLAYCVARENFFQSNYNFVFKPVSLPHIINKSGNSPPASLPARAEYLSKDLSRSAQFYGVNGFKIPKKFPFDTRNRLYELISLIEADKNLEELDEFIMNSWNKIFHLNDLDFNMSDGALKQKMSLKAKLTKNTEEALNLGAYGVPFWRIENEHGQVETFFGSDRFHHIAKFLQIDHIPFYSKI